VTARHSLVVPVMALMAAGTAVVSGFALLLTLVISPSSDHVCGEGVATAGSVRLGHGAPRLTASQRSTARTIIAEGTRRRLPQRGIIIALAVANQESRFTNYANDGLGNDLDFLQLGIQQSMRLPHQAVGSDHGSLGVFQQQWPWWGTMRQLMTPSVAAGKFYDALLRIPGWSEMPVTVAAQRVQRSAHPGAYADDESLARALVGGAVPPRAQSAAFTGQADTSCAAAISHGTVVSPLPKGSGFVDQRNWGHRASIWARGHTGTDLSVACGTPVLAATAGTIIVRTDQHWAGRWLVEVSTGGGKLTTWYAHMQALAVTDGEQVSAGQHIGDVGALGNATGCHLHFEVHPAGGSIYQDNVNPSVWLHQNVELADSDRTAVAGP
jgi:hypothetical protein